MGRILVALMRVALIIIASPIGIVVTTISACTASSIDHIPSTNNVHSLYKHYPRLNTVDGVELPVDAEVVGASGRVGSMFLNAIPSAKAAPKGLAPGCLSSGRGCPIYVTTPAKAWRQILDDTLPHRREDLVWIGNGIPPLDVIHSTTTVVPHFGVLQVNGSPVTSVMSPSTVVYGKHSTKVARILQQVGISNVDIIPVTSNINGNDNAFQIVLAAAQKLLWAASMWLLCHDNPNGINDGTLPTSITALQVHTIRRDELESLVRDELFPALSLRLQDFVASSSSSSSDVINDLTLDVNVALEYMYKYSQSMPDATPSLALAKEEWKERNAFFLAVRDRVPQPKHEALLHKVGGISIHEIEEAAIATAGSSRMLSRSGEESSYDATTDHERVKVDIPSQGLTFVGTRKRRRQGYTESVTQQMVSANDGPSRRRTAIVVGGGILGSSVALHLARQGVQVTVIDAQSSSDCGRTTPASWAWLNANGKEPSIYAWLNQLGMEGWRRDPVLVDLPTWCGSLVRFNHGASFSSGGGYRCEGPLDRTHIRELEPAAAILDVDEGRGDSGDDDDSNVYFFPEEGMVDPAKAVQVCRQASQALGVRFLPNHNVTGFITTGDNNSRKGVGVVCGILAEDLSRHETVSEMADVVVLTAGIGCAQLAQIPLLHRPGQIAFADPLGEKGSKEGGLTLKRILVDTVREAHVLQRTDGKFVIGGGALEVGGAGGVALATTSGDASRQETPSNSIQDQLLSGARKLVPGSIGNLIRTEQAVRPIPLDGLPAVGYVKPGLYSVVSHSGITLSPILASLAASELANDCCIPMLENFRPTRFFQT